MALITTTTLRDHKRAGEKIAVLTAYDFPTARLVDESNVDVILVGDSAGMVVMGRDNTLSVTLDEMIHHTRMVSAGVKRALVVADMPFMTYQTGWQDAVRNAGRLIAEGGAQAVKLEGPAEAYDGAVQRIIEAGIPVMGHLGLTPQSVHKFGGYKVQGRDPESQDRILHHAQSLEKAGCFSIVLECVPAEFAARVTESLDIPTIGIGAGVACDGQVLVMHDILGWGQTRFTKTFGDARGLMLKAFNTFADDVKKGTFPAEEHTYK